MLDSMIFMQFIFVLLRKMKLRLIDKETAFNGLSNEKNVINIVDKVSTNALIYDFHITVIILGAVLRTSYEKYPA